MRASLKLFPGSACEAVAEVAANIERDKHRLTLQYVAGGRIGHLWLPRAATSKRADNLWQHTCFELFVGGGGEPYYEFNFSPSAEWAAYAFTRYREGMRNLEIAAPLIKVQLNESRFELNVALDAAALPQGAWRVGLSSVIEDTNGRKSYWALAHASGKPDFHNPGSFILELPA